MTHILVFLLLYLGTFVIGSLVMSLVLYNFDEPMLSAMGAVATSLGNVGPSIADLGPVDNFSGIPIGGKGFLSFLMLLGRLEIFTVLILLTPYFYRTN
jgi:trk system potassium uptake protein TrkH